MDGSDDIGIAPRYSRTLTAWLLTVAVPPFVVVGLIAWSVSERCGPESVDCSWGFEYLLAIPVLLACVVTLGPLAVYLVLRRVDDPLAAHTVRWLYVLVLPATALAVVIWQTIGLPLFVLPPLGSRYQALRRHRGAAEQTATPGLPPAAQERSSGG